ncbi:sodium-coupled monocarboxylate transporter 2 X3, partial [Biomphalaria glabrata]
LVIDTVSASLPLSQQVIGQEKLSECIIERVSCGILCSFFFSFYYFGQLLDGKASVTCSGQRIITPL